MSEKIFLHDEIGFIELLEFFGNDLTVANAARVSFHKESSFEPIKDADNANQVIGYKLSERDKALIHYLATHNHVTPFFHPQLRFRVKMPIFIAREWYRHTVGFARNEVSRRYVTDAPDFFMPAELRQADKDIKQGSSGKAIENNIQLLAEMKNWAHESSELYNKLLKQGVCAEQARTVLPQSMYTEFIETASLAGYARLARLRLDPASQKEIRVYAQIISNIIESHFPVSWAALMENSQACKFAPTSLTA